MKSYHILMYLIAFFVHILTIETALQVSTHECMYAIYIVSTISSLYDNFSFLSPKKKQAFYLLPWVYFSIRLYIHFGSFQGGTFILFFVGTYFDILNKSAKGEYMQMLIQKFKEATDMKNKWFSTLEGDPNGVLLYEINSENVVYRN